MITEDYVSFETAKLLKRKGFDEICRAFWKVWNGETNLCHCNSSHTFEYCHNSMLEQYNDAEETNIAAPTLQMAMKWLREVYSIHCDIGYDDLDWFWNILDVSDSVPVEECPKMIKDGTAGHKTYEEACEAGIKYCLENLI